jgi:cysteine synthase A
MNSVLLNPLRRDILRCIGQTSILSLNRIGSESGSRILLKMEGENPTGSIKDRAALAMIETAEKDDRLPSGGAVVEYTGGSAGVSLALVCAVKGHPLRVISSDAFAREKLLHMKIFGAELQIIASEATPSP